MFNYSAEANRLLTHQSVARINVLHEFLGEKKLLLATKKNVYETMSEIALLHSVAASARDSGINVSFTKIRELIREETEPQNDIECLIVYYAQALSSTAQNSSSHENMMEDIMSLYAVLQSGKRNPAQCQWRTHDKPLIRKVEGVEFSFPVPPHSDTPERFQRICSKYSAIVEEGIINPLYIMPMFIIDFVAIQPFERSYYEMNRLIISYLMNWAGYDILDSISFEHCIRRRKKDVYKVLGIGLQSWHKGEPDYQSAFQLWMELSQEACSLFEKWVIFLSGSSVSTVKVVLKIVEMFRAPMTKRMIMEYAPDIGESSIERALNTLCNQGHIKLVRGGRYSEYVFAGRDK
jgi:hypothetical protein